MSEPTQSNTIVDDAPLESTAVSETMALPDEPPGPSRGELGPPAVDELPLASMDMEGDARDPVSSPTPSTAARRDLAAIGLLGEGGMGRVLLASQRSLRRRVAVKIANQRASSAAAIVREGVVTGMLEHPNIPPVHSLGRDARGRPLLVMKNIEGVSWASVLDDPAHPLRAESPLFAGVDALEANLEVLAQLCNVLELAHARGIVHRDIKPANVMLGRYGEVYLIDWGVAFNPAWHRADEPIGVVGTASYLAPEMVAQEVPDSRTDVYLLGATLHEVLTGAPPHEAETVQSALARAFASTPVEYATEVPAALGALCRRAMARAREDRPPSVREFRDALRRYRAHRASIAVCERADRQLSELLAALAAPSQEPAKIATLQQSCRLGYAQALAGWDGNPQAHDGMQRMLRALCERELKLDNVDAARALLGEMALEDATLARAVAAREEERRRERERTQAMDMKQSSRERTMVLGLFVSFGFGLAAMRAMFPPNESDLRRRHLSLLIVWILLWAGGALGVFAVWRRFSRSELNLRFLRSSSAVAAAILVNRVAGVVFLPGAAVTLISDATISISMSLLLATFVARSLAWSALPALAGVAAMCVDRARVGVYFNASMTLVIVTLVLCIRREVRRDAR
jgi:serine/threonine-protein kinase